MKRIFTISLLSILPLSVFSQVHWTKHPDNPIMIPGDDGDWTYNSTSPCAIMLIDSTYHMYYNGIIDKVEYAIGHATSLDGISWTKDSNNPILEQGANGEWDSYWLSDAFVLKVDTLFHAWYTGSRSENTKFRIGHATSSDGVEWVKDSANPVKDIDESISEAHNAGHSPVLYDGNLFHIYFFVSNFSSVYEIWHATSQDGYNWIIDPLNPVIEDTETIYPATVVFDGDQYLMWYGKGSFWEWEFYLAYSSDGSVWEKHGIEPVLSKAPPGGWDGLCYTTAVVLFDSPESKYKMWYGGAKTQGEARIGYAESSPYVEIPDITFLNALIDKGVDTDGDGLISYAEAQRIQNLNIFKLGISDLTGIEAFVNLSILNCGWNALKRLDVSKNTSLKYLHCKGNQLTSLDVSSNNSLLRLDCIANHLTSLDVTNNTSLVKLECYDNPLTSLKVSGCNALKYLDCSGNQLASLDVSGCNALEELRCGDNQFTSLDFSGCNTLEVLSCGGNQLTSLDVSAYTALTELNCGDNQLTSLIANNIATLKGLSCAGNKLTNLDVSGCNALEGLFCYGNQLTSLDVSNNTALAYLWCWSNQLSRLDVSNNTAFLVCSDNQLTSLNVSGCDSLKYLVCEDNQLTSLDVLNNTKLQDLRLAGNQITSLDVSNNINLQDLHLSGNQLTTLDISANRNLSIPHPPGGGAHLSVGNMPSLGEICVWEGFNFEDFDIDTTGSPNVCFQTDCNGECENTLVDEITKSMLSIYPNPTNTLLTIEFVTSDLYNIEITTLNGKLILSREMEGTTHQVDLSSFQKGVYFITIRSKDFVATRKIVKL